MVSKYLGEHLCRNRVQKNSGAVEYQKYTKFNQNCPKITISNFCCFDSKI